VGSGAEPGVTGCPGLIVLVGGESTGKSTLARALTDALDAIEVPEALRDWVASHRRVPNQEEQWDVMAAQASRESAALNFASSTGAKWVVSDGGPMMTAVYSSLYYRDDSLLPEAQRLSRRATLIVWCDDDIPWVADEGQRDGPDLRAGAQRIIGGVLRSWGLPWIKVSGEVEARVAAVVEALGARSGSG
jgi:nicotinamide riboside kinase